MVTLAQVFSVLTESAEFSTVDGLKNACEFILDVRDLDNVERDCLRATYEKGPLSNSDMPSWRGRDQLVAKGFATMVIVEGVSGYTACTHKGAMAYQLLRIDT